MPADRPPLDRLRIGVAAAGFCTFVNLYAPQALLPTLADYFGVSLARTGYTITACLVAVALVAPFVGSISDAVGRKRLIVGAAALLTLPTLGTGLAGSIDGMILYRFLQGLLLPFIFAVTVAYIAEERPGPAGVRATGTYLIGCIVGGFAGRFITGWTTALLHWRVSFVILAALAGLCAAVIAVCLPRERNFRPVPNWRSSIAGFADQFRNRQVMSTCGIGFAVLFSIVATFTYANFLLAAPPFGLGPAALGSIFVVYLFGTVSTPIASRLIIRYGRRRALQLATAIIAVGLGLTLLPVLAAIIAGMALVAIGVFAQQAISMGHVAVSARQARSTAVGLYVTTYYIGGSLGGIAPGWVWVHAGWPGCVALALAVQLLAVGIASLVWPRAPNLA